jgi:hypothetical protein
MQCLWQIQCAKEEEMLGAVHVDPSTNTHWIQYETGLSYTLHEEHLYCLEAQFVQGLQPGDNNLCLHFCLWFIPKIVGEPDLLGHVLWIDEAAFTRSAVNNLQSINECVLENFVPFDALHFNRNLVSVFGPLS